MTRSYYCSNKFKFIKIDLERQLTYNCHAAHPHSVNFEWLDKNQGNIFNIPVNVAEREQMLRNERNASCEQNCWPAEDRGQTSTRIVEFGTEKTHTQSVIQPSIMDVTLDSECNMSCVYCCKEFSSTWRREIATNGPYVFPHPIEDLKNRYHNDNKDEILLNLSQRQRHSSKKHQMLFQEVDSIIPGLNTMYVSGGEPLLSTQLVDLLAKTHQVPNVNLFTGLGVNPKRLATLINKFSYTDNLTFVISAESVGRVYEFIRYNNTYDNLLENLEVLDKNNIKFKFHATISNLTLHGFTDFYKTHWTDDSEIDFAYTPTFFAANVLDDESKQQIKESLSGLTGRYIDKISSSIDYDVTEQDRINLKYMLNELAKRRNFELDFYPQNFLNWINK